MQFSISGFHSPTGMIFKKLGLNRYRSIPQALQRAVRPRWGSRDKNTETTYPLSSSDG